jgi:hypothetical protein
MVMSGLFALRVQQAVRHVRVARVGVVAKAAVGRRATQGVKVLVAAANTAVVAQVAPQPPAVVASAVPAVGALAKVAAVAQKVVDAAPSNLLSVSSPRLA